MSIRTLLAALPALLCLALFEPLARGDDELRPFTYADRKASQDNLKKLAIAIQYDHAQFNRLPVNIYDKDGKPLLSWRVAILPHLGQQDLYKQFNLNEPWDSENNKKLIEKMPKVYAPIRVRAKPGETYYQMFDGKDAALDSKNPERKLTMLAISQLNGTSNTGMVCEAGEPVIWTKPADLPFDKDKPLPKLGGLFDGNFHVLYIDGHSSYLEKNRDETAMKRMIMWTNTEPFDLSKMGK